MKLSVLVALITVELVTCLPSEANDGTEETIDKEHQFAVTKTFRIARRTSVNYVTTTVTIPVYETCTKLASQGVTECQRTGTNPTAFVNVPGYFRQGRNLEYAIVNTLADQPYYHTLVPFIYPASENGRSDLLDKGALFDYLRPKIQEVTNNDGNFEMGELIFPSMYSCLDPSLQDYETGVKMLTDQEIVTFVTTTVATKTQTELFSIKSPTVSIIYDGCIPTDALTTTPCY